MKIFIFLNFIYFGIIYILNLQIIYLMMKNECISNN